MKNNFQYLLYPTHPHKYFLVNHLENTTFMLMINVTKFWFLKDFSLFKKMGKNNLITMCHLLKMITVKKGETLFFNKADKKETAIMYQSLCLST